MDKDQVEAAIRRLLSASPVDLADRMAAEYGDSVARVLRPEGRPLEPGQSLAISARLDKVAALSVDVRALSPTFRREVAKREVRKLLGDESSAEVLTAIEKEIDAAEIDLSPEGMFGGGPPRDDEDDDEDEEEDE